MTSKRNPYEAKRTRPFTIREIEVMCQVTAMTVHNWRQGSPTKEALKADAGPGRAVRMPTWTSPRPRRSAPRRRSPDPNRGLLRSPWQSVTGRWRHKPAA